MTAICSGGASQFKPAFGPTAFVLPAAMGALLNNIPVVWAVPLAAYLGGKTYDLSTFCTVDPPADPVLTATDVINFLNVYNPVAHFPAATRVQQLVDRYAWYQMCECASVATPAPPAAPSPPANMPTVNPPLTPPAPTTQGFYPMVHSQTKALALGCGTPTAPTGWYLPGFNDAAWVQAVGPTLSNWSAGSSLFDSRGYYGGDFGVANPNLTAYPIEYAAPANPLAHNCEQFLLRWRFHLGNVVPDQTHLFLDSTVVGSAGWGSGVVWINGVAQTLAFSRTGWQGAQRSLIPNADNLIAIWVDQSNTGSANVWGSGAAGAALALDYTQQPVIQPAQPCCPPDPAVVGLLSTILENVRLMQRQLAPFAYVSGPAHTALSGAGTFDIQGLLGVRVNVTTIPGRVGEAGTSPTEYFDLGYLTFGTADGYPHAVRLERAQQLVLPARCSVFTTLAYDLTPGVVVTITELVREP